MEIRAEAVLDSAALQTYEPWTQALGLMPASGRGSGSGSSGDAALW